MPRHALDRCPRSCGPDRHSDPPKLTITLQRVPPSSFAQVVSRERPEQSRVVPEDGVRPRGLHCASTVLATERGHPYPWCSALRSRRDMTGGPPPVCPRLRCSELTKARVHTNCAPPACLWRRRPCCSLEMCCVRVVRDHGTRATATESGVCLLIFPTSLASCTSQHALTLSPKQRGSRVRQVHHLSHTSHYICIIRRDEVLSH